MLDLREIDMAIEELERDGSTMSHCSKLATLYTVRDHLNASEEPAPAYERGYSMAYVEAMPSSEFLQAVRGKDQPSAWEVMDELMDTLKVVNSKVYESVMRKIRNI